MDGRRLIDADDFVEWLLADAITDEQRQFAEKVRYAAEKMPTVDAVPVRCKDCKFFSHGYCRFHDAKFVRPDGYCYWGEQKEGEQHD